jgi:hypothetical protein
MEQFNWFVQAEFRLFCGTENSWNSVPNHYTEENSLEFRSVEQK